MSDDRRPPKSPRPTRPRPGGDRQFRPRPKRERSAGDGLWLYGLHTVELALKNPRRRPLRLLATRNALMRLAERFEDGLPLEAEDASPMQLDKLLGSEAVHQGVALEVEPLEALRAADLSGADLVLALDQVTDPHNVGAILRSACALGVGAVITTARHSPAESGVLAKAASGALDLVPVMQVRNLGDTLEEMKAEGFQVVGLDSEAPAPLEDAALRGPVCLVLGAEGKGLRQRTRDICDVLARLDMPGPIKSLNVSNACVLSLYVVRRAITG
ncbi:TrmH family RNA methyltransferase [Oharaeibacter diazotrophicus]|uniref:23S rRNA (Guanosine2251-2'-O)-methyltransferase n=1 Tax=Oharaeibacter diazotrophicus TaxID=1920512 RepID=A0A4R6RJ48_9HYPH|nr:RNA methyltransferase [Oharaeibacter diazotrophicus]TDP86422.1 23S rRNA (guanosine2251-2'-O)-methyltransferase [Oharaeibacter diazotrophicus]BBE71636.1 23S rRNA (guanosine-2'-O-)-methyltransferase RlmB [Pleomorphomonas sp. SM30]GLS78400.1 23S rRNA (guanosine-2'-O-)-methyltransferase [Oharaeibacter diazotrophicus]